MSDKYTAIPLVALILNHSLVLMCFPAKHRFGVQQYDFQCEFFCETGNHKNGQIHWMSTKKNCYGNFENLGHISVGCNHQTGLVKERQRAPDYRQAREDEGAERRADMLSTADRSRQNASCGCEQRKAAAGTIFSQRTTGFYLHLTRLILVLSVMVLTRQCSAQLPHE